MSTIAYTIDFAEMGTPIESIMMCSNTFITGFDSRRITRFETDCDTSLAGRLRDWSVVCWISAAAQNSNLKCVIMAVK